MIRDNINILSSEIEKLSNQKITNSTSELLANYYMAKTALESLVENTPPMFEARIDSMPALANFQNNHTEQNLQRVCLEIRELCLSVWATLRTEEEKTIFKNMVEILTTI